MQEATSFLLIAAAAATRRAAVLLECATPVVRLAAHLEEYGAGGLALSHRALTCCVKVADR